jgi:hypothetical protein
MTLFRFLIALTAVAFLQNQASAGIFQHYPELLNVIKKPEENPVSAITPYIALHNDSTSLILTIPATFSLHQAVEKYAPSSRLMINEHVEESTNSDGSKNFQLKQSALTDPHYTALLAIYMTSNLTVAFDEHKQDFYSAHFPLFCLVDTKQRPSSSFAERFMRLTKSDQQVLCELAHVYKARDAKLKRLIYGSTEPSIQEFLHLNLAQLDKASNEKQ